MELTRLSLPDVMDARKILQHLASQKVVCAPRKVDKPLILYGAGELGKMAKCFFDMLEIPFLYVVDINPLHHIQSNIWKGIPILKPEDVPAEDRAKCLLAISIATKSYTEIIAPLLEQGWQDIVPFYDIAEAYIDRYPLSNGWFTGIFDNSDMAGMQYALDNWDDDISRAHHLQFIAWHGLRKDWVFDRAPVTTGDRFFIPQILSLFHEREVFIDGGAYHGEVSLRFMNIVKYKFSKLYAVEPDNHNFQVLRAKLADLSSSKLQDIEIIKCALGKKAGIAQFCHGLDYTSQFSSLTQDKILVNTLDDMDIKATFIKLHLEGWEYEAIQGGMNMLHKYRPILTVTTYHKRNGLWRLPVFLMENLDNYFFLFRLHAWMGTGGVLYAIPRERCLKQ